MNLKNRIYKIFSFLLFTLIFSTTYSTNPKANTDLKNINPFEISKKNSSAFYTPAPTVKFTSPASGSNSSSNKITVNLTLKPNNSELVNRNLYIWLFVANSPDPADQNAFGELATDSQTIKFTSTTQTQNMSFSNVPLFYQGKNYIYCFVYDPSGTNIGDLCGGYSTPQTLLINYTGNLTPVYRFWSDTLQRHFYTASHYERKQVTKLYGDVWNYEKIAYFANMTDSAGKCSNPSMSPVYRFWSEGIRGHFYTANEQEKNAIIAKVNAGEPGWDWKLETPSFTFCGSKTQVTNTSPVYRFWSLSKRAHFYTNDEYEKNAIIAKVNAGEPGWDWKFEGLAYYVYK